MIARTLWWGPDLKVRNELLLMSFASVLLCFPLRFHGKDFLRSDIVLFSV